MSYHGMDFLVNKAEVEAKEFSPHPWTGEFIGKLIADHIKNGRADEAIGLWRGIRQWPETLDTAKRFIEPDYISWLEIKVNW